MKKILLFLFQSIVITTDYNYTNPFLSFIKINKSINFNLENFSINHELKYNLYNNSNYFNPNQNINIQKINESIKYNNINLKNNNIDSNNNSIFFEKKNLIIGSFQGFNWSVISPFFNSFKKARFENCICVMFVNNVSQETINKVQSLGIIVYSIPEKYNNLTIINYRWKLYKDFINENREKYNLIFTADVRDVYFQKDVFKFYENKKSFLGVAIEDNFLTENMNKKWLIEAYGQKLYETIKNERIICVGTIWGTPDKFCEFCEIMWEKLNSEWSLKYKVIEQAVGNYIIYHDKMFNDCLIKSDNSGPVMTVCLTKRTHIKLDKEKNILNRRGKIAAVIHQYDRKPDLMKKVQKKYCEENNFNINDNIKNNNENEFFSKYQIVFISTLIIFYLIRKIYFFSKS